MSSLIEIARHCANCELDWCATNCPYSTSATTLCRDGLLTNLANKLEGLENAYNSCLEALEEYEKAEEDRPIFKIDKLKAVALLSDDWDWSIALDETHS